MADTTMPAPDVSLLLVHWRVGGDCPILASSPDAAGAGAAMATLLHPADRDRFLDEIGRAVASGRRRVAHAHHRIVGADGGEHWWQTVSTLAPDGAGGVLCTSHAFDITDDVSGVAATQLRPQPMLWALLDSIPEIIFLKDRDSRFIGCNRTFGEAFGVDRAWLPGRTDFDLVAPDLAEFFRAHDRATLNEGRVRRIEEWVTLADGRTILLETLKAPFAGLSGEVIGLIGVARDVTEANRARRELHESEERVRLLLHSSGDGIYGLDQDGRCTFANAACARLLGYDGPDELMGQPIHEMIYHSRPDGPPLPLSKCAIHHAARHGKGALLEVPLWRRDDTCFVAEMRAYPILREGQPIGSVVSFTDATERRRVQEHLRTLSQAVEQGNIAIVIADVLGGVTYINPRLTAMTGLSRDGVPDLDHFLAAFAGEGGEALRLLWRALSAGEPWHGEFTARHPDGSEFQVATTVTPVRDAEGRITNFLGMAEDVTERRLADEHIRRAQKMQAVGVLAGGIAHDFNNILTVIMGYSHLALEGLAPGTALHTDLVQVTGAAERAKDLVRQLLTFSRLDKVGLEVVDLRQTVEEALKLIQPTIPLNIALHFLSDDGAVPVMAAPSQIHQLIFTLCKNATDAIGEAAGTVAVSLVHAHVETPRTLSRDRLPVGRYACLTVADSGCGMTPAILERIFEPFYTTKPVDKGTGLGLAAVHGIVASHGGVIDVASSPGQGSAFTVYLPIHETVSAHAQALPGDRPLRALVVGDDPGPRRMIACLLRAQDFRVVTTGHERRGLALFAIAPDRFDLVVLTRGRDDETWKLLTLARAFAASSVGTPILLCGGHGLEAEFGTTKKTEMAGITLSPVEPVAFIALVDQIIGKRFQRKHV